MTVGVVGPACRLWAFLLLNVHRTTLDHTLVWALIHACIILLDVNLEVLETPLLEFFESCILFDSHGFHDLLLF